MYEEGIDDYYTIQQLNPLTMAHIRFLKSHTHAHKHGDQVRI